ncbi:PfkB family carbohydrate kinase, partial [Cellulomonas carbonis]|uniref:PfkB family carbohydrate kinase n=1 Tax=Cellulomonas carbonis TaxID=1386092 RepID=UPI001F2F5D06
MRARGVLRLAGRAVLAEAGAVGGVVVVGQVARDLVLAVDRVPDGGGSTDVTRRIEVLGGKGANQGVGCRQLGADVALVGVVGDDDAGRAVLAQARLDGLDVSAVVRRSGTTTALLVDVVEADGTRRLLEHVPDGTGLTADDVRAAAPVLRRADAVLVQLQQPADSVVEALRSADDTGALVVVDGAPADDAVRAAVLEHADVVRADEVEAAGLLGRALRGVDDAVTAATELVGRGPRVVALEVGSEANVVAWDGGHVVMPLLPTDLVDPTGGGDAFVAGLTAALLEGADPATAGWWGSAAAASVVARLGGRPALDRDAVA